MKNRFLSIVLVVVMMMNLLVVSASAASNATLEVSEDTSSLTAGSTITVTATVPAVSGIASGFLKLVFDNETLDIQSINAPSTFAGYSTTVTSVETANSVGYFTISIGNGASSNFDMTEALVLSATFVVSETATEGSKNSLIQIDMNNYYFEDADSNEVTAPAFTSSVITGKVVAKTDTTTGYTASVSPATQTVNNDGTASNVTVNVVVNKAFNSAELKLSYDKDYLTFVSGVPVQTMPNGDPVTITGADGVITIRDYGAGYAAGNAYSLTFTSTKGGVANVAVTSAGFSTEEEAETTDLITATTGSSASVTINHKVTVNNGTPTYVAPNGTYDGNIPGYDAHNYTYDVVVKMGGVEQADPTIDANGHFTISPVTGELVITYTATPNTYNITWKDTDSGVEDTEEVKTVVYGNPVTFNVAADKAEGEIENGYHYNVLVYLTADTNKTPIATSSSENADGSKKYTIAADKITGHITIEVSKITDEADKVKLDVTNSDEVYYNDQPVTTINVSKNEDVTLTLKKETGYTYKVEQFTGDATTGTELTVNTDGTFTVTVGTQPITIKVTKTLDTSNLEVEQYVSLNGKTMWLVTVKTTQIEGKTYHYSGTDNVNDENFYWSSKYNSGNGAYCFLVVENADTAKETVKSNIASRLTLVDGTATVISYDGNVNLTFKNQIAVIDVNDAQLVWNMYSAVYSGITENVTVQKFLKADMDNIVGLNTTDAAQVVAAIPAN